MKTYITLLSNDEYFLYTMALWHSWKEVRSKYPLTIIAADNLSDWIIEKMNTLDMNYIRVDMTDFDEIFNKAKVAKNWREAFRKLIIFKLTQFDKVIFLDSDTIMVKNMDHLFDMPMLTCTGRYNSKSDDVKALLSGMFVCDPNLEDYNKILTTISNVINGEYEEKGLTLQYVNDEHILSEVFKGRMNGLPCSYQWMPHVFNRGVVPWSDIYLVHIGAPKKKWFTEDRFINNEVTKPFSPFDYNMIYWYFNKLDEVVNMYDLNFKILKRADPVDMTVFTERTEISSKSKKKKSNQRKLF